MDKAEDLLEKVPVLPRLLRRFTFALERWIIRGPHFRFLAVAAAVGLLSVGGGVAVRLFGSGFDQYPDAVWWSFLRLTDPGYLGDDVGVVNRVVSTFLTVAGYVVFMGALVAIMTQWLQARMSVLESGVTRVTRNDHVVILGWTSRTHAIVRELLVSQGRVRRFLEKRGAGKRLQVVILAEEVSAARLQDLRDAVGDPWEELQVTLRSGSALRPDHLKRVDIAHAAAVIIPGAEFEGEAGQADTETVKVLLSLERLPASEGRPLVVAEIFQDRKAEIARTVYRGDHEIICSGKVVSRLLAQNLRYAGLSTVFNEILSRGNSGNAIYIRDEHGLDGASMAEARSRVGNAVLLGTIRTTGVDLKPVPQLNPPPERIIQTGDALVCLARSYEDTAPDAPAPAEAESGAEAVSTQAGLPKESWVPGEAGEPLHRRILILGWNHKAPALLDELAAHEGETFEITQAAGVAVERREQELRFGTSAALALGVRHVEADTTDPAEVALLKPENFDTILIIGSDWSESEDEADARALMAMLVLRELLAKKSGGPRPTVVVELLDPANVALVGRDSAEIIVSPLILSHMLAQVALRRELNVIFDELFGAGGVDLAFRSLEGWLPPGPFRFHDLIRAAGAQGMTALGVRDSPSGSLWLNPPRDRGWNDSKGLEVVALVGPR
ncbi:MAG: ion channel DMI1 [Gemmatimonadota bacterium]